MRFRTVLALEAAVVTVALLGALLLSEILGNDLSRLDFGATAIISLVLAASAMLRRSWARIPLVATCLSSLWLLLAASSPEGPDEFAGAAFVFLSGLIALTAGLALMVSIAEHDLCNRVVDPKVQPRHPGK
jgi:hypothetical protein